MSDCAPNAARSMFAADLAAIFADQATTVSVVFGAAPLAQSTRGFPTSSDVPENDGMGGVVIVHHNAVSIVAGTLTGLADDLPITVDGVTYTIHGVRDAGRGRTMILLAGGS